MRKATRHILFCILLGCSVFSAETICALETIQSATVKTIEKTSKPSEEAAPEFVKPDSKINPAILRSMQENNTRRYRIGIGDELIIEVFKHPEYSKTVRVNDLGIIQLNRIEKPIQAVCKTESELSEEIVSYYKRILRQPYVSVFVKEFKSQPVAVIGAVDKPGQFFLNRKMRLLQAISLAGGQTKEAGSKVLLARMGEVDLCSEQMTAAASNEDQSLSQKVYSYNLRKTIEGDDASNPWLQPGDIVSILEADKAYVVGNVKKPTTVMLKEPMTLSQAIAAAEGILPSTKKKQVLLIRQDAAGNKTKQEINLLAINEKKANDPVLQPNDIVEVPLDGAKETRNNIIKALTGGLSSLPFLLPF